MLEQPTCLVQLSPLGQGGSRRPEEEGQVKGKAAVSPAHLLTDTPGTVEGHVGLYTGAKGGVTDIDNTETVCKHTYYICTTTYV